MIKIKQLIALITLLATAPLSMADVMPASASVRLGTEQRVKELYSYPNNCAVVVCYQKETLEQTVMRWFTSSVKRDGFDATTKLRLTDDIYFADITLRDASQQQDLEIFVKRYEAFLDHGETAINLAREFNRQGNWMPNWRFILPHGLAMSNNNSLEVMNFPPVKLLYGWFERSGGETKKSVQDYLNSPTTHRWNKMLMANGVESKNLDTFISILDIVPIGAPADKGSDLRAQKVYDGAFDGYAKPMLALWTTVPGQQNQSKPIMTLGSEMKTWFNKNYQAGFENILDVTEIEIEDGRTAPIMFTNHPSKILYSKSYSEAKPLMDQDAVAACWQAQMGLDPSLDPITTKQNCASKWDGEKYQKCSMIWQQLCDRSESDARHACENDWLIRDYQDLKSVGKEKQNSWCTKAWHKIESEEHGSGPQ